MTCFRSQSWDYQEIKTSAQFSGLFIQVEFSVITNKSIYNTQNKGTYTDFKINYSLDLVNSDSILL